MSDCINDWNIGLPRKFPAPEGKLITVRDVEINKCTYILEDKQCAIVHALLLILECHEEKK